MYVEQESGGDTFITNYYYSSQEKVDKPTKINIIIGCIMSAGLTDETKQQLISFMREVEQDSKRIADLREYITRLEEA